MKQTYNCNGGIEPAIRLEKTHDIQLSKWFVRIWVTWRPLYASPRSYRRIPSHNAVQNTCMVLVKKMKNKIITSKVISKIKNKDFEIDKTFKAMKHYFMFILNTCCVEKKWSGQETTEACDWVIGTHISDKWRPYAFGLIDIFVCY